MDMSTRVRVCARAWSHETVFILCVNNKQTLSAPCTIVREQVGFFFLFFCRRSLVGIAVTSRCHRPSWPPPPSQAVVLQDKVGKALYRMVWLPGDGSAGRKQPTVEVPCGAILFPVLTVPSSLAGELTFHLPEVIRPPPPPPAPSV